MEQEPLVAKPSPPPSLSGGASCDLLATQEQFDRLLDHLSSLKSFAVDTEADSYYSYANKICLFQFSTATGDFLLDPLQPLDFSGLGDLFANPRIEKVFHAGENDIGLLRVRFGFSFCGVFDTMVAAQVIGYPRCGLAALLSEFFGVTLEKRYQTSDWRSRPLSAGQIDYAHRDTRYLLPLRERLGGELIALGRLEEAESEFRRVEAVVLEQRPFDPNGYTRLRQARHLSGIELSRLKQLFGLRNSLAEQADRAPYRILDDAILIELACIAPRDENELARVRGFRPWKVERFGGQVLQALRRAEEQGELEWPKRRGGGHRQPELTSAAKNLLERLRRWRDERARGRGVGPARVATTSMLTRIAVDQPTDLAALAQLPGMDAWRLREYGDEIIAIVEAH